MHPEDERTEQTHRAGPAEPLTAAAELGRAEGARVARRAGFRSGEVLRTSGVTDVVATQIHEE